MIEVKAEPQPTADHAPQLAAHRGAVPDVQSQNLGVDCLAPRNETAEATFMLEQRRQQMYIQHIARQVAQQRGGASSVPMQTTTERRPRQAPLGLSSAIHAAEVGGLYQRGLSMPLQFLPGHTRSGAAETPTPPEQKRKRPAKAAGGRADKKHKSVRSHAQCHASVLTLVVVCCQTHVFAGLHPTGRQLLPGVLRPEGCQPEPGCYREEAAGDAEDEERSLGEQDGLLVAKIRLRRPEILPAMLRGLPRPYNPPVSNAPTSLLPTG